MQRPLLLNGFMASGKSSVGRRVAAATGTPFIDLDEEVERRAGCSVAELFASAGEGAFRALEATLLHELLEAGQPAVVALGGGALLGRQQRVEAIDRAVVVRLEVGVESVLERVGTSQSRPLLAGPDRRERISALIEQREAAYCEAHASVPTDGRQLEAIAEDVAEVWRRDPLGVAAGSSSHWVEVGTGVVAERLPRLVRGSSSTLLVTDTNVGALHAAEVEAALARQGATCRLGIEPGEEHKNAATLLALWQGALQAGADRKSTFVGLGGGVVTDLTGLVAATWMRGVRWVGLPTSLLAMVDASVGGKTAIDLGEAKNAVGAFWQPSSVLCDVAYLATEPERGYLSALAEVVKTALIGDPALLALLEEHVAGVKAREPALVAEVVRRSVRVKARIVSQDERESGLRATLNLGHTVGHALEAYGGYGQLRHGEAISLGLIAALELGEGLGVTAPDLTARCRRLLAAFGLPVQLRAWPLAEAAKLLSYDKKRRGGTLRFIVVRDAGQTEWRDLDAGELVARVRELAQRPDP